MNYSGIKSLAVIILLAALFTGCPEVPDEPQKQITVTGIPGSFNRAYGTTMLCRYNYIYDDLDFVAYSNTVLINNGNTAMKLYDAYEYYMEPYTKDGNHTVIFFITDYWGNNTYYAGIIESTNISNENTSLPFNYFAPVTLRSVLPATPNKLNFDELMPLIIEKLKKE